MGQATGGLWLWGWAMMPALGNEAGREVAAAAAAAAE